MNFKTLFANATSETAEVRGLVFDAKAVGPGTVFFAIRGTKADGHDFIEEAIRKGADALVVEDRSKVPKNFRGHVQVVTSSRRELARLSARWQDFPSRKLFTVGVTGTNGKTTTTHMIEAVLNHGGLSTGVIGTIDHHLGKKVWSTERTTPDPVVFQKRLREFLDEGAQAVALEVTSHALDQARVEDVEFDVGIFTNLTRDHLDYHGTIEAYFESKLRFFDGLLNRSTKPQPTAILHVDDPWIQKAHERLKAMSKPRVWTFGRKNSEAIRGAPVDFQYEIRSQDFTGAEVQLISPFGDRKLRLAMAGIYNIQNAVGAMATGLAAGFSMDVAAAAIASVRGVNGRLESIENKIGLHVFIDYAHTDAALTAILNLLSDLRRQVRQANPSVDPKIITVFGCGGDRDAGKRPLMMKAALAGSDQVVITSDNPRTEDPEKIIDDAMMAVGPSDRARVHRVVDRRQAIQRALEVARKEDVILIAGKGHEATQTIGTSKVPFLDAGVVRELLSEKL